MIYIGFDINKRFDKGRRPLMKLVVDWGARACYTFARVNLLLMFTLEVAQSQSLRSSPAPHCF